ncbi:MAG TPA: SNF2-related protein [Actinospica sp.]|jgi:ERCC4-related helicase|nr:SNF2-related protein [Actinospica sp.]
MASGGYPPGSQILVRDEEWLVRKVTPTQRDGLMIEVTGVSEFVRDTEAVFYDRIDRVEVLDPRHTKLVADDSSNHSRARLYLEAVVRKSFLPQSEQGLALAENFLMDTQVHQLRPAELALSLRNPQPRLLIADVVGLGKTLEIGILLAELIRRGRGERILVITPQHVLEQFQRELWTRFAIPLVRLDSTGIQRVQQEIPSGRNPFAYFKRVIVSVDTLKNRDLYRHHLDRTNWDAVVIDESHNLITIGSQRNELARAIAPRTDALILASATPHNGDGKSFAELIRLLDPAAIKDPKDYEIEDLDHLFIRRTKVTPEVRDSLKDGIWADRGPSRPVHVPATPAEERVFQEFAEHWIPRDNDRRSASESGLTAYTLFKSFLSSHKALLESLETRRKSTGLESLGPHQEDANLTAEQRALKDLYALTIQIDDSDSAKLTALVDELRALEVGPGSPTRVVVFSERIATLKWLAVAVPAMLGFPFDEAQAAQAIQPRKTTRRRAAPKPADTANEKKPWLGYGGAVQVMHDDATGVLEQMSIIERFGLREDPVRILFTGDVASEGVNLHQQCNLLIHYDLPWSLIRIEQRNGRIDRYGQSRKPEFRALILTSATEWRYTKDGEPRPLDDRLVGEKLLKREEEAHKIEGSAEAVTGLFSAGEEDSRLVKDLIAGKSVEQSVQESKQTSLGGLLAGAFTQVNATPKRTDVPRARVPKLFDTTPDYFSAALNVVFNGNPEDALTLRREQDGTIALTPPRDLLVRFKALPSTYLKEQIYSDPERPRLLVTFDKDTARRRLTEALQSSNSQWPSTGYLTDLHPMIEWITDKVLVQLGRHQAPVLRARVGEPTFLIQGTYSNQFGRPTVVEWMAVGVRTGSVAELLSVLADCGVGPGMPAHAVSDERLTVLQPLVAEAIDIASRHLMAQRGQYDRQMDELLEEYRDKLDTWHQPSLIDLGETANNQMHRDVAARRELLDKLAAHGEPMLRLLAVLDGEDD